MSNFEKADILIVDDDESITSSLSFVLKRQGYRCHTAFDYEQAVAAVDSIKPDLVIQDMNFSRKTTGEEGLALLESLKASNPQMPVILMTAWSSVELAVQGMRLGAADFLAKPWSNDRLLQSVATALNLTQKVPSASDRALLDKENDFANIIGQDPKVVQLLSTIARIAKTDAPVLILGESGTGKELVAEAIHNNSLRNQQQLVRVNLGGIPNALFESEMFGHVKGAFTDAKSDRKGRFELAHMGSIFLDEIGEMDKAAQVKLLRVLQDQSYQAVGSSASKKSNTRVIAATNADLQAMVANQTFREDLLYRINLITLRLPPLRERKGDIELIANHVLQDVKKRYGIADMEITKDGVRWLSQQQWPGNIRQLKQMLERAVLMSSSPLLDRKIFESTMFMGESEPMNTAGFDAAGLTIDEMEMKMITSAMETHQGNLSQVATALGLSRQALYRRMEKYGIQY